MIEMLLIGMAGKYSSNGEKNTQQWTGDRPQKYYAVISIVPKILQ